MCVHVPDVGTTIVMRSREKGEYERNIVHTKCYGTILAAEKYLFGT